MKRILILLAILLLASAAYADQPILVAHQVFGVHNRALLKASLDGSSSFDYGPSGIRASYLYDGRNGGLSIGIPLYADGYWHLDPIASLEPLNGNQVAAGFAVAYDWHPIKGRAIIISPMVGFQKPLIVGDTGASIRAVFGGTVKW